MARNVRTSDLVLLWGRAAGMCSHPDCKRKLVLDASAADEAATVGEAAHIVARAVTGPRGDMPVDSRLLDRYDNLILLCRHHHGMPTAAADAPRGGPPDLEGGARSMGRGGDGGCAAGRAVDGDRAGRRAADRHCGSVRRPGGRESRNAARRTAERSGAGRMDAGGVARVPDAGADADDDARREPSIRRLLDGANSFGRAVGLRAGGSGAGGALSI